MIDSDNYNHKERLFGALTEYRRERADSPQYYYNELTERGRAVAWLRPKLESFLGEQTSLSEFKTAVTGFSRRERAAARGREQGRYWRFSGAGRLFLDSFYKQAEKAGRLNALSLALQGALKLPGSLDEAGQQLSELVRVWRDVQSIAPGKPAAHPGLLIYTLSYFWAVQNLEWPIYSRETRTALSHLELLGKEGADLSESYSAYYLAFLRLAKELQLNAWELESFLHWRSQRDELETATLSAPRRKPVSQNAQRRRHSRLEELRAGLETRLRNEIGAGLRGVTGRSAEVETLVFQEPEQALRLEIRLEAKPRAGVAFDGFSVTLTSDPAGAKLAADLNQFLTERPEYHFYTDPRHPAKSPTPPDLLNEFYLLQVFEQPGGDFSLVDVLVNEWRILYPFARSLISQFDEFQVAGDFPPLSLVEEPEAEFAYPVEDSPDLQKVAEEQAVYDYTSPPTFAPEEEGATLPELSGRDMERRFMEAQANRQAAQEVLQIARMQPPPLTTEQAEAIKAYVEERLVINPEKITEILTHLEAGRSVLMYGPPGCGKTRLARLLAGQLGGRDPGWLTEGEATNYTLATATAEWSVYEVIGGIRPGLAAELEQLVAQPPDAVAPERDQLQYYFEPGVVARAALDCETSLRTSGRPHHLIIDEFNRANQDRAFGELFTLLEYRDRPLLPAERLGRRAPLYIPLAFRIIGTMNSDDRNSLFEVGMALRRRFALVEIDLPPPEAERRFLPKAIQARLPQISLNSAGDFAIPELRQVRDKLMTLVTAIRPDPLEPGAGGKKIGTGLVVEALIFCAVAARFYQNPTEALEDAILADILPQLDRAPSAIARALKVVDEKGSLAELRRVRAALQRMTKFNSNYFA